MKQSKSQPIEEAIPDTKFHRTWYGMHTRCGKVRGYENVKVLWKDFEEFKNDMLMDYIKHLEKHGARNTTIDRIDSKGNYCKENCRWATFKEQVMNSSRPHFITTGEVTLDIRDWSKRLGMSEGTIARRLTDGWSDEDALKTRKISGVAWSKRDKKWIAKIGVNYKTIYLGQFKTREEAEAARLKGEKKYNSTKKFMFRRKNI